ncbi:MAG: phosphoserine phosphatase SerB [Bdellovibrionales bacterium]|nr:phosphoserine phosphatase SerB [Bdellovibrionales bacterium]
MAVDTHKGLPLTLVTCSGRDTPGITAELTGILASSGAKIVDIGQAVLHGWLSLSMLFEPADTGSTATSSVVDRLLQKANELGLKMEHRNLHPQDLENGSLSRATYRYALTLIAPEIPARTLYAVTQFLAQQHINIDVIERLSEGPFGCVEMLVSSRQEVNQRAVKLALLEIARNENVDIALQAEGLYRRAKRLIVFDMDSTLIQSEIIDEFAREMGVYEDVAFITHQAMSGKIPFGQALQMRVAKLKGLTLEQMEAVFARTLLTPGAEDLIRVLQHLGYRIALISGGFSCIADRLKSKLGIHYAYANHLMFQDGICTGEIKPPIVDALRKADLMELIAQQESIELDQVIAVGDGANDIPMLEKAGLGIAFNAKPSVSERADLALSQKNLKTILYLLGISGRDLPRVLS